ncbi:protein MLP1-like [Tribolium madens]|uniref:protein MLP1-like n=1 Tax=Tribolium madens TaxID=41895 RepID=UPI001CF73F1F|nr:protein MLP1-like [Tribolium madens]
MAQIMEFLLNLLLLRGKFLTTAAAETLHEYIKKCMQFKRKISTEYNNATQIIPFENMLEFINDNSSKYICEGDVVTNDIRYLYEHVNKIKQESGKQVALKNELIPQTVVKKLEKLTKNQNLNTVPDWLRREQNKINNDLKSQEFLFKNIIKLVNILEKDAVINSNSEKLDKIKKKLVACTDILSNAASSQQFTSLINKIIEEEITRCRFRHGESKTSAEINLRVPKPEGIEAALDTSQKNNDIRKLKKQLAEKIVKPNINKQKNERLRGRIIDMEVKTNARKLLKRAKSEPVLNENRKFETIWKKTQIDIEESKKVIQVNEDRFNKFENTLWHTLTTMKFMSLKNDYANMCKCAFYNKRQFVATEATISKKVKEEENFGKFVKVSNSMFHITEKRLSFEEEHQDFVTETGGTNKTSKRKDGSSQINEHKILAKTVKKVMSYDPQKSVKNAPPVFIQNQKTVSDEQGNNTVINGNDLKKLIQNHSPNATFAVIVEESDKSVIKSREIVPTVRDNKQTNTIISVHSFPKKKTTDIFKNISSFDEVTKSEALNPIKTSDEGKPNPLEKHEEQQIIKNKEENLANEPRSVLSEKIKRNQQTDKHFVQSLRNSDLNEKKPSKTPKNVKMRLNVFLKRRDSLGTNPTKSPSPITVHSRNEEKKESLTNIPKTGKKQNFEITAKLQTIPNDNLKLCTMNAISSTANKENKKVSMHEFKSEADLIYVNNKAFQELETTIKTVQIVKKCPKTNETAENVRREKKSVSSENLASILKQRNDIKREMKSEASSRGGGDEKVSKNKRDLHTEVKKLPSEKGKTFLKNSKSSQKSINLQIKKSFVKPSKPNPSNFQMRRTTKNAMKRQQVMTILPKIARDNQEKKKAQIRLVETEEIKTVKMKQLTKKESCVAKKSSFVKLARNFSPKKMFRNSLASRLLEKSPNKKINRTNWEEEEGCKVVTMVED